MPKARNILNHANAIKGIRTVTKTMEMVSSARFKRIHDLAVAARPYTEKLARAVSEIVSRNMRDHFDHPLLTEPVSDAPEGLLVLTSNRGLCGAFNSQVIRLAMERKAQLEDHGCGVQLHVVGKKGIQSLSHKGVEIYKAYNDFEDLPSYPQVNLLAETIMNEFLGGRIGGMEIACIQFRSAGRQHPAIVPVVPLDELVGSKERLSVAEPASMEFFPSPGEILDTLLPATIRQRVYQCFLDSAVSEQIMRIAAMRGATDSADDMIHDLKVQYNRTRQSAITTELAEIMGGRANME